MAERTVSNTTPKSIVDACSAVGIETSLLLSEAGIPENALKDPAGRVTFEEVVSLWDASYAATNNRMIGIEAARCLPFGSFKVIDYLIASSSTSIEGLDRARFYYPIINEGFQIMIDSDDNFGYVELYNPDDPKDLPFHYVDFVLACILIRIRFSTGFHLNPLEVQLTCRQPSNLSGYHGFFKAPFKFGQSTNQMVFEKYLLEKPLPNADPRLVEMLDFHACKLLAQLPLDRDVISELSVLLENGLANHEIALDECARELGLSRRSLQRQLSLQGTSYRELLTSLKCDLAKNLLSQRNVSIEDIAFLVGYSEPSAFYKAFKNWTGHTPREFIVSSSD